MNWCNLRLEESVMQRLQDYRIELEGRIRKQPARYPESLRGKRLSLGEVVDYMLLVQSLNASRNERWNAKRKGKAGTNGNGTTNHEASTDGSGDNPDTGGDTPPQG